jgi:hypothetical protein
MPGLSQAEECSPLGDKGFIFLKLRVSEGVRWERKKAAGRSAFLKNSFQETLGAYLRCAWA